MSFNPPNAGDSHLRELEAGWRNANLAIVARCVAAEREVETLRTQLANAEASRAACVWKVAHMQMIIESIASAMEANEMPSAATTLRNLVAQE